MFKDFFETSMFVRSITSTLIIMVWKKGGVEDFKDFRPISFVGSLYMITIVLPNRLKKVMYRLVNKTPLCGREAYFDAPLIANEVIGCMLKRRAKGILCQLDIEKAYYQINFFLWFYIKWDLALDGLL